MNVIPKVLGWPSGQAPPATRPDQTRPDPTPDQTRPPTRPDQTPKTYHTWRCLPLVKQSFLDQSFAKRPKLVFFIIIIINIKKKISQPAFLAHLVPAKPAPIFQIAKQSSGLDDSIWDFT